MRSQRDHGVSGEGLYRITPLGVIVNALTERGDKIAFSKGQDVIEALAAYMTKFYAPEHHNAALILVEGKFEFGSVYRGKEE